MWKTSEDNRKLFRKVLRIKGFVSSQDKSIHILNKNITLNLVWVLVYHTYIFNDKNSSSRWNSFGIFYC